MNRLERSGLATGRIVLLISLQFLFSLFGWIAASVAAIALGATVALAWMRFELSHRQCWVIPSVVSTCCAIVFLIVKFGFHGDTLLLLSIPLAAGASFATALLSKWDSARCGLCNRRLRTQTVVFQCPRCRLHICEETCWSFEHRRCHLCLEQRVPVLSIQDRWWLRAAGPRYDQGRCQVCLAAANQVDLRCCPNCRRPQCRDCWDFHNGGCVRCGASLPYLPESLTMAVAQVGE